jgi:hypothetical protein
MSFGDLCITGDCESAAAMLLAAASSMAAHSGDLNIIGKQWVWGGLFGLDIILDLLTATNCNPRPAAAYSLRSASTGGMAAARRAGNSPERIPVTTAMTAASSR